MLKKRLKVYNTYTPAFNKAKRQRKPNTTNLLRTQPINKISYS